MQRDFAQKYDNPIITAKHLSFQITKLLRENKITVYEAYLLQGEVINYTRDWYTKPAWDGFVSISTCLEIFNQRLMALAFNDTAYAHTLQITGQEAFRLCSEKRQHYIMDRYSDFMNIDYNSFDLLDELSAKRENCKYLEFDEGPFHYDVLFILMDRRRAKHEID